MEEEAEEGEEDEAEDEAEGDEACNATCDKRHISIDTVLVRCIAGGNRPLFSVWIVWTKRVGRLGLCTWTDTTYRYPMMKYITAERGSLTQEKKMQLCA